MCIYEYETIVCRVDEWQCFRSADVEGVQNTHIVSFDARGGSMAHGRLRRMHPRWRTAKTPKWLKLLTRGH